MIPLIDDGEEQIVLIPPRYAFTCEEVELEWRGDALILKPISGGRDKELPTG